MKELDKLREQVDKVDTQLLKLLNRRARTVKKLAKMKADIQAPTLMPHRENQILQRLRQENPGPFPEQGVESVFGEIFSACRSLQNPGGCLLLRTESDLRTYRGGEQVWTRSKSHSSRRTGSGLSRG